jgi:hypothetical protein
LGWNGNDLDKFILDGMWRMLGKVCEPENGIDAKENNEEEVAEDGESSERPDSWIFPGQVAY